MGFAPDRIIPIDTLHDVEYWKNILMATNNIEIVSIKEMKRFK